MKRSLFLATMLASVLLLASCIREVVVTPTPAPTPTRTPTPGPVALDPLSVATAYYEAFNAGDIETLAALLADDVVITFEGFGPGLDTMGKLEWLAAEGGSFAANAQITFSNPGVEGNTFTAEHSYEAGDLVSTGTMEMVVEEGKITSFWVTLDE